MENKGTVAGLCPFTVLFFPEKTRPGMRNRILSAEKNIGILLEFTNGKQVVYMVDRTMKKHKKLRKTDKERESGTKTKSGKSKNSVFKGVVTLI